MLLFFNEHYCRSIFILIRMLLSQYLLFKIDVCPYSTSRKFEMCYYYYSTWTLKQYCINRTFVHLFKYQYEILSCYCEIKCGRSMQFQVLLSPIVTLDLWLLTLRASGRYQSTKEPKILSVVHRLNDHKEKTKYWSYYFY